MVMMQVCLSPAAISLTLMKGQPCQAHTPNKMPDVTPKMKHRPGVNVMK
jgi:hypothetical protein